MAQVLRLRRLSGAAKSLTQTPKPQTLFLFLFPRGCSTKRRLAARSSIPIPRLRKLSYSYPSFRQGLVLLHQPLDITARILGKSIVA